MPALGAGIHVLFSSYDKKDVDGTATRVASRVNPTCGDKPGHDELTGASFNPPRALAAPMLASRPQTQSKPGAIA
jgi:hypothetical protein